MPPLLHKHGARVLADGTRQGFPPRGTVGLFLVEEQASDESVELVPYIGTPDGVQQRASDVIGGPAFFAAQRAQGVHWAADSEYGPAVADGTTDNATALDTMRQAAQGHTTHTLGSFSVQTATEAGILPAGILSYSETLDLLESIRLRGAGGKVGTLLKYTGTGTAIVVHTTELTNAATPTQNVREFGMEHIALHSITATEGIRIGAKTFWTVEFLGGSVVGIQGRAFNLGESVYYFRLGNSVVRDCDEGIYVGEYCDLFTVNDRCFFTGNRGADLILACPTFHIENSNFEGSASGPCHIEVRQSSTVIAANRDGVIFNNRFGPEIPYGTAAPYDIKITRESGTGVTAGLRIIANKHYSKSGGDAKVAPICIDAPVKNLTIRDARYSSNYSSGYLVTCSDVAAAEAGNVGPWASGTETADNFIDDILTVHPTLRGLFAKFNNKYHRQVVTSVAGLTGLRAMYSDAYSTSSTGPAPKIATLVATQSGALYPKYLGVLLNSVTLANRHTVIALPGAQITTAIDSSAATYWDPVYVSSTGDLTLTKPTPNLTPLVVGRVLSVGANATILLTDPEVVMEGEKAWDPGSVADGALTSTTVTVPGAVPGDFVESVSFSNSLQSQHLTGYVSGADTVTVVLQNETGGAIDLANGTLRARCRKPWA